MKKRNNLTLYIAGFLIAAVSFAGATALANKNDETKLSSINYDRGELSDVTGKFDDEEKVGLVTKKYYKLNELSGIEIEDEDVTVYINFYDEDKNFLEVQEVSTDIEGVEEFEGMITAGAYYFKLEIVDNEDDEISLYDLYKLSQKVTVTLSEDKE